MISVMLIFSIAVSICVASTHGNWHQFSQRDVWNNRHHQKHSHHDGRIVFPDDESWNDDEDQRGHFDANRLIGGYEWNNNIRPTRTFEDFKDLFHSSPATTERITTSTVGVAVPGMGTRRSPCEDRCLATMQYDPVCGDNGITYTNMQWFKCALRCGRKITMRHLGSCRRAG